MRRVRGMVAAQDNSTSRRSMCSSSSAVSTSVSSSIQLMSAGRARSPFAPSATAGIQLNICIVGDGADGRGLIGLLWVAGKDLQRSPSKMKIHFLFRANGSVVQAMIPQVCLIMIPQKMLRRFRRRGRSSNMCKGVCVPAPRPHALGSSALQALLLAVGRPAGRLHICGCSWI